MTARFPNSTLRPVIEEAFADGKPIELVKDYGMYLMVASGRMRDDGGGALNVCHDTDLDRDSANEEFGRDHFAEPLEGVDSVWQTMLDHPECDLGIYADGDTFRFTALKPVKS